MTWQDGCPYQRKSIPRGNPAAWRETKQEPLLPERENLFISTEVQNSILAQLLGYVKEIRYQQPIFLYGEDIIGPNNKQNVVCNRTTVMG